MLSEFKTVIFKYLRRQKRFAKLKTCYNQKIHSGLYEQPLWLFNWLLIYNQLADWQKNYLDQRKSIGDAIKIKLKLMPKFINFNYAKKQLSTEQFGFLSAEQSTKIADCLAELSAFGVELTDTQFNDSIDPEIRVSRQKKQYQWVLAQTIDQLGISCVHSMLCYYFFLYYINEPVDSIWLDYSNWLNLVNDDDEKHLLEFAVELFFADIGDQRKFIQSELNQQFDKFKATTQLLEKKQYKNISDQELIWWLYKAPQRGLVKQEWVDGLFENYVTGFPDDTDRSWSIFWQAIRQFDMRTQAKYNMERMIKLSLIMDETHNIVQWYRKMVGHQTQESLWCLALDNKKRLINYKKIFTGTVNLTISHPRDIFAFAIANSAVSIVIIHNHPSGEATPSQNDIRITEKISKSGSILGITVDEHLIICSNNYYSFSKLQHIYD